MIEMVTKAQDAWNYVHVVVSIRGMWTDIPLCCRVTHYTVWCQSNRTMPGTAGNNLIPISVPLQCSCVGVYIFIHVLNFSDFTCF